MARRPRKNAQVATTLSSAPQAPSPDVTVANTTSQQPTSRRMFSVILDASVRRAFYLVLLAALYAPLSQLILAPVYGSIPSTVYHKYGLVVAGMLSFAIKGYVPIWLDKYFAAFVFWIPVVHFALFQFSSTLGNPTGPLVIECVTLYPLVTTSIYLATKQLQSLDLSFLDDSIAEAAPPMLNYFLFTILERTFRTILPTWMGTNKLFTRVGLQMLIATTYTTIVPQSVFWPAFPALIFNALANVHAPLQKTTELLNNTLHLSDYALIDRHESLTGYISVLQNNKDNFRVMRCDHSLLGGEWILPPNTKRRVAEPVYAVFTMLEAVRLVDRKKPTEQERALNIGLGVGTAPSALLAHGVSTTIIELDPTVHRFAVNYFGLPQNHTAYIGDAINVVETRKAEQQAYYDYIIHDVFTGGAEPVDLFTFEFLSSLSEMLKPDGVIAINYAGDLRMPSTSLIYRTINKVFPTCRVFREDEQISEGDTVVDNQDDFTNMVFFCRKNTIPVEFRKPVEADFLGSKSRKAYMVPKHEVPAARFVRAGDLLTRANTKVLEKLHVASAIGHWQLMRKVMPATIWENW
ncbi:hypothetical protein LTR64_005305 [Lithohypha guttulata]|uniref:uncharacterized protein n=1 Tax=Lithohypha guttulata TaxID=1690604 RepID=UPI002DDEA386|nr:hypothetical protein LTR51_002900 [Lithohypha guttulata]